MSLFPNLAAAKLGIHERITRAEQGLQWLVAKRRISHLELYNCVQTGELEMALVRQVDGAIEELDLREPAPWVRLRRELNRGVGCSE